jgi:hypothetical protein
MSERCAVRVWSGVMGQRPQMSNLSAWCGDIAFAAERRCTSSRAAASAEKGGCVTVQSPVSGGA